MKLLKWLWKYFEESVLVASLAGMALIMMLQIVMRYVFGRSLPWPEEVSRYLLVVSCYMGSGYILRQGFLIRMDVVLTLLPKPVAWVIDLLGRLVTIVFFGYFCAVSIGMTAMCYRYGMTASSLPMPYFLVYAVTALGFFLGAARGIQSLVAWVRASTEVSAGEHSPCEILPVDAAMEAENGRMEGVQS